MHVKYRDLSKEGIDLLRGFREGNLGRKSYEVKSIPPKRTIIFSADALHSLHTRTIVQKVFSVSSGCMSAENYVVDG